MQMVRWFSCLSVCFRQGYAKEKMAFTPRFVFGGVLKTGFYTRDLSVKKLCDFYPKKLLGFPFLAAAFVSSGSVLFLLVLFIRSTEISHWENCGRGRGGLISRVYRVCLT